MKNIQILILQEKIYFIQKIQTQQDNQRNKDIMQKQKYQVENNLKLKKKQQKNTVQIKTKTKLKHQLIQKLAILLLQKNLPFQKHQLGLLLRNKRDRKVIKVDPNKKPEDSMTRTEIESPEAIQIVLYDYYTRNK